MRSRSTSSAPAPGPDPTPSAADPVLAMPARVRLPEAAETLARLMTDSAAAAPGPLRISLAALQDSDSSVIAVLLALHRAQAGRLELHDVPERVRSLARLYGVEPLLFGPTP